MVARVPDDDDWVWRVSIADVVEDGPFSVLPGVDRWIAVVDGAGMALTVDGTTTEMTCASGVLGFDGGAVTSCRLLGGPVHDLNLMVRRGGATGSMEVVDGLDTPVTLDGVTACVVLDGTVLFGEERLDALDAIIDERGTISPVGAARVALIRVS